MKKKEKDERRKQGKIGEIRSLRDVRIRTRIVPRFHWWNIPGSGKDAKIHERVSIAPPRPVAMRLIVPATGCNSPLSKLRDRSQSLDSRFGESFLDGRHVHARK